MKIIRKELVFILHLKSEQQEMIKDCLIKHGDIIRDQLLSNIFLILDQFIQIGNICNFLIPLWLAIRLVLQITSIVVNCIDLCLLLITLGQTANLCQNVLLLLQLHHIEKLQKQIALFKITIHQILYLRYLLLFDFCCGLEALQVVLEENVLQKVLVGDVDEGAVELDKF